MSAAFDLDPEVLSDLRLRESTVRERGRERRVEDSLSRATLERPVVVWPCRNKQCCAGVGVTQSAVDALGVFNAQLVKRGEEPIRTQDVVLCPDCRDELAQWRSDNNRTNSRLMADTIQQLRASTNPRSEHKLIAQLTKLRHPDVHGLLDALDLRSAKGTGGARRRDL